MYYYCACNSFFTERTLLNFILCNFLVQMLKYFQNFFKFFFGPQKVEKTTLKSCSEFLKSTFFFLTALTAQTAQTEEFLFKNLAYWLTVYRTGEKPFELHCGYALRTTHVVSIVWPTHVSRTWRTLRKGQGKWDARDFSFTNEPSGFDFPLQPPSFEETFL